MSLSPSPKRHAAAGHDSPGAKFEFQHFLRHFQKRDEAERAPRRPRGVSQWWFWTWNTWGKLKPINDDTLGVFSHFRTPSKIYGESWEKNMKWTNKSFDLGLALCSRAMNPPFQPIDKPVFFGQPNLFGGPCWFASGSINQPRFANMVMTWMPGSKLFFRTADLWDITAVGLIRNIFRNMFSMWVRKQGLRLRREFTPDSDQILKTFATDKHHSPLGSASQ